MSLTSYRAAPPRDKLLRALPKTNCRNGSGQRPKAPFPSGGFLRRQPLAYALGCERYVPTRARFGKGREVTFEDFVTAKFAKTGLFAGPGASPQRSCQKFQKGSALWPKAKHWGDKGNG